MRQYYDANAEQIKKRQRQRNKRNKDAKQAYNQEYYKANQERLKAQQRVWNAENREVVQESNRRYRAENPDRFRALNRKRRVQQLGADGFHTEIEWFALLGLYGGRCAYCGDSANTRDHVVPLNRGGSDWIDNIVPACRSCNSSKGNRLIWEWHRWPSLVRAR
jgi:5-methylcytosine-specific restriction endonuclease McrA